MDVDFVPGEFGNREMDTLRAAAQAEASASGLVVTDAQGLTEVVLDSAKITLSAQHDGLDCSFHILYHLLPLHTFVHTTQFLLVFVLLDIHTRSVVLHNIHNTNCLDLPHPPHSL